MNSSLTLSRLLLSLLAATAPAVVLAQGALVPAGAPAPTMKSLAQIEARVDVATLPGDATAVRIISQPGSYYLTADVVGAMGKHGVRIDAHDVTLDLNGFSIRGVVNSQCGIYTAESDVNGDPSGFAGIVIRNGFIREWGSTGVRIGGTEGAEISGVQVRSCVGGIRTNGGATRIERCVVRNVTGTGINLVGDDLHSAIVRDCLVEDVNVPGGTGIGISIYQGMVEGCRVRGVNGVNATGIIVASSDGHVANCNVADLTSTGASGTTMGINAAHVRDCTLNNVQGYGASSIVRGIYWNLSMRVSGCRVNQLMGNTITGIEGGATIVAESLVQSCSVSALDATFSAIGIQARSILDCHVVNVGGPLAASVAHGVVVSEGGLASRCSVRLVEGNGIHPIANATVADCSVDRAGTDGTGDGINISSSSRVERNRVSNCPVGYRQNGTAYLAGNFADNNTTNYTGVAAALIVDTYLNMAAGSSVLNVSF